jgi:DNA-binding FrmR family transcriptional regulator
MASSSAEYTDMPTVVNIAGQQASCHADVPTSPGSGPVSKASYSADKAKILARLRRIEGQVRGVERMVEDDAYCVDVLTQISSIIASLRSTGMVVLEDHIRGCVVNASEDRQEDVLDELTGAIERFVKSVG